MRFVAYFGRGAILTDDYSADEVAKGTHIENIKDDLRRCGFSYCKLYDENMRFLKKIHA